MGECRNCGASELQELGSIGLIAPFFLKRVLGIEVRAVRSLTPVKQKIRELAGLPLRLMTTGATQNAYADMQICLRCSFIQTCVPFHDDDIMRLYVDYRSETYNRERIQYEPTYAPIAAAVGQNEVEIRNRTTALAAFLRRSVPDAAFPTMLDFGGSDGKFMPRLPGSKYVYEISNIAPVPGVTRIGSEAELGTYSIVFLAHVTEHVPHPLQLVRKVSAYVEPGGYLYIETPQEIPDETRDRMRRREVRGQVYLHEHINSYCMPAVRALLESAGFAVVDAERAIVDVGWATGVHLRILGRKSDA